MRMRMLLPAVVVLAAVFGATGCGGGSSADSGGGGSTTGGILRVGTANTIDSLNPFIAIESQSYNAFVMEYPQLVQYGPGPKLEGDWATSWYTLGRRQDLDVQAQAGRQVVGRQAADRRRRRLDRQHDRQVSGRRDGRAGARR